MNDRFKIFYEMNLEECDSDYLTEDELGHEIAHLMRYGAGNVRVCIFDSETLQREWHYLTDDEDSYPEPFRYVLIEDDDGDQNIACCYPDYDWYITNGENSMKLIGEVVKWAYID